jgi:hypothetical protein
MRETMRKIAVAITAMLLVFAAALPAFAQESPIDEVDPIGFEHFLRDTVAKLKHVIMLTDGVSSPGDFAGLAQQMASSKITVEGEMAAPEAEMP